MYGFSMSNGANYSSPSSNTSGSIINNLAGFTRCYGSETEPSIDMQMKGSVPILLPDMMMSGPLQVVNPDNPDNPELSSTVSHNRA
ncbi:CLN_G0048330.mRNA.1.CDS.1 [Saccharomyces cerevisiae]|nr:CLN_G0048330.mRNA.1.CDS.1 [Saccharomyces cerevisiae]CAI7454287.1 CLN_G0048330.mRNA.1.CDS.1 [Saccharomyces cerevisiae]